MSLTSGEPRIQLIQARAEVVAKQSALAEERTALVLEIEQTRNQIVEAEAALKESESTVKETQGQMRIATSNWERAQALFQEGIVPIASRDQAQDTLSQVQARLNATQERVAQLRARLNNAQNAQKRIQLRERKVQTLEAEVERRPVSAWSKLRLSAVNRARTGCRFWKPASRRCTPRLNAPARVSRILCCGARLTG